MKTKNKQVAQLRCCFKLGKVDDQIVALLQKSGKPMTLAEIADELGKPSKAIFKGLQKLFSKGKIDSDVKTRTYKLAKE